MNREDEMLIQLIKKQTGRDTFKCCLCGGFFHGYGNNPHPVNKDENERCCDACNDMYVIPARIAKSLEV